MLQENVFFTTQVQNAGVGKMCPTCSKSSIPYRGFLQVHKSEGLIPGSRVSENTAFDFYYAIYYAILFFTTLFTTLREAPANDLYVFWLEC